VSRPSPLLTESITVKSYVDLLPPTNWGSAGRVWRWMISHGLEIAARQEAGGPVYGVFYSRHGRHVVNVGDTISRSTADGAVVWSVISGRPVNLEGTP
jgi:hypothetical protein